MTEKRVDEAEFAQLRESYSRVCAVAEQRLKEIERLSKALAERKPK